MRQFAVPALLGVLVLAVLGALILVNTLEPEPEPVARRPAVVPVVPAPQTFQPEPATLDDDTPGSRDAISGNRERYLQVGVDIKPGLYQTDGPFRDEVACNWARTKKDQDDVITKKSTSGPATERVDPKDGWFYTAGCKPWRPVN